MCVVSWNVLCQGKQAAQAAVSSAADNFAESAAIWASNMVTTSLTWWVTNDTIDPDTETVYQIQQKLMPIIGIILMCSVLAQCIRIVIQRKFSPALDLGMGVGRYVLVTTMGLSLLGMAVAAGDAFSAWILQDTMTEFKNIIKAILNITNNRAMFSLLFMGLVFGLLSVIQWILAFIRQAGIMVLAVLLPLAAAGTLSQWGKDWLSKMLPWLIALVAYKPMAAVIYVIGVELFMNKSGDLQTAMVGMMVLGMASVSMPAMMKFFSWAGAQAPSGGGGGAALGSAAQAATGAAPRSSSQQQASFMDTNGPNSGGAGSEPSGSAPSSTGSGPRGQAGPSGPGGGGPPPPPGGGSPPTSGGGGSPTGGFSPKTGTVGAVIGAAQTAHQGAQRAADESTGQGE